MPGVDARLESARGSSPRGHGLPKSGVPAQIPEANTLHYGYLSERKPRLREAFNAAIAL